MLLERGAELAEDVAAALPRRSAAGTSRGQSARRCRRPGPRGEALANARDQMRRASHDLDQARDPAQADKAGAASERPWRRPRGDLVSAADLAAAVLGPSVAGLDDSGDPALRATRIPSRVIKPRRAQDQCPTPRAGPAARPKPT